MDNTMGCCHRMFITMIQLAHSVRLVFISLQPNSNYVSLYPKKQISTSKETFQTFGTDKRREIDYASEFYMTFQIHSKLIHTETITNVMILGVELLVITVK